MCYRFNNGKQSLEEIQYIEFESAVQLTNLWVGELTAHRFFYWHHTQKRVGRDSVNFGKVSFCVRFDKIIEQMLTTPVTLQNLTGILTIF